MLTNIDLAMTIMYVFLTVNVVFILIIYIIKTNNIMNHNTYHKFNQKSKDYLIYIQANLESEERLRVPPFQVNAIERKVLQERLNDMIETFTDEQRQKLIDLCEQLGLIRYHLQRLHGRSYRRKIEAAYHLGCMRVKEALPALFQLLHRHKLDSTLFIIARAIAKCSRDEDDVKQMVRILLKHKKSFPDLVADIIEEAPVDPTMLFTQFLLEEDPALIHIGLTGLKEYTNPGISAAVYRLIDSDNAEIQRKAIMIYLKSFVLLPKNVVNKLLQHSDAELRLVTIQTVSELHNPTYIDALEQCLHDQDQRVVYASAAGLIQLGQGGVSILCDTAKKERDAGRGTYLQTIIEEELRQLSNQLHDVDYLTRYNALKFTFERTFGREKKLYRVV